MGRKITFDQMTLEKSLEFIRFSDLLGKKRVKSFFKNLTAQELINSKFCDLLNKLFHINSHAVRRYL